MDLARSETLGPLPADTWAMVSSPVVGPGTFVFFAACPLEAAETLDAQVLLEGGGLYAVVEDFIGQPTDLGGSQFGFQSAPLPLMDVLAKGHIRAKHHSALYDQPIEIRVLRL